MHLAKKHLAHITPFSEDGWSNFLKTVFLWKELNEEQGDIARQAIRKFDLVLGQRCPPPQNVGYHRECYKVFMNTTKINRAIKRKLKRDKENIEGKNYKNKFIDNTICYNTIFHIFF